MMVCQGNAFKVMVYLRLLVTAKKTAKSITGPSDKKQPIPQSEVPKNSEKI